MLYNRVLCECKRKFHMLGKNNYPEMFILLVNSFYVRRKINVKKKAGLSSK